MPTHTDHTYPPIENYGIIGNLHTAALVSRTGSIDFMSFVRFDSPTIFCRLLDAGRGGFFSIHPDMEGMVTKQLYLPDTNILVTRFLAEEGIAEITDFMPVNNNDADCAVIRRVTTIRGKVTYNMVCAPRFDYARDQHTIEQEEKTSFLFNPAKSIQQPFRLLSNVTMHIHQHDVKARFSLQENESAAFILEALHNKENRTGSIGAYVDAAYHDTLNYWQRWISRCTYWGKWQEMVHRSALVLKLLSSQEYGSMIAAPTFGLPEAIGYERNWDYRYTWIRDAAFSMHAFLQLGFIEEASDFLLWVKKQSTDKELQLMFAIDGETKLEEQVLHHLDGYRRTKPVRIGNDAYRQQQLDIYGELMQTLYVFTLHGGDITYDYWLIITKYVEFVIKAWKLPDHSIWEVRGQKREFLFSRIMCWIALDRAIKIAQHFSFPFDMLHWHEVRDEIFRDIYNNFWNEEKQAYVQYKHGSSLDASALLMPIMRICSPFSERWKKTMKAIEKELRSDVLIYRYRGNAEEVDGLKGEEGTFTMCSFWYVEYLELMGEEEKAREYFEKMPGYANHLGLYAEQLGMKGEFLGNFPQAFTHLGLISAALQLSKQEKRAPEAVSFSSQKKM